MSKSASLVPASRIHHLPVNLQSAAFRTFRLGLTGGIGSGKSTVAQRFKERGAVIIDADQISRSMTATGGPALPMIRQTFGADLIDTSTGALDRTRMRELVFSDPTARQRLEAIIHPLISDESARQVQAAITQQCKLIVHDLPLLVESKHWRSQLDAIVVIDCRESTQIERVIQRSHLSTPAVEAIIKAQARREQRLAAADWVIYNDEGVTIGALHAFTDQIADGFGL